MFSRLRGSLRPSAGDHSLDFGVQRLKDIAFERAIEGQLIPVFVAGKLMGFRRKHNDRLLMFMLRHYGQDAEGRRVTLNYFSARASAGGEGAVAEAGAATVRSVTARGAAPGGAAKALADDRLAAELAAFPGVALDAEAEAAINAALEGCAARARAADAAIAHGGNAAADAAEDDPAEPFVRLTDTGDPYRGVLEPVAAGADARAGFVAAEPDWSHAGGDDPRAAIEAAVAEVKRVRRRSNWPPAGVDAAG